MSLRGTSRQHCEVASRQVEDLLADLPIMKARFARTGNRCKFARNMATSLIASRERLDAEQGWSDRSCVASTMVRAEPVLKFMRQMQRFSKSCDEEAASSVDGLYDISGTKLLLIYGAAGAAYLIWKRSQA